MEVESDTHLSTSIFSSPPPLDPSTSLPTPKHPPTPNPQRLFSGSTFRRCQPQNPKPQMDINDCFYLGRINKPWGIHGQMSLYLDVDEPQDYATLDSAFVEIKGQLVPHFFHIDQLAGNRAIVTFDDLSPDDTARLSGKDLYLPLSLLPKLDGNKFYYHEVVGFHVVDRHHGDIGTLQQVIDYPAQPILQIDNNGTEILVPLVDPLIEQVDRNQKTLHINAPNGLIELYMGEMNT